MLANVTLFAEPLAALRAVPGRVVFRSQFDAAHCCSYMARLCTASTGCTFIINTSCRPHEAGLFNSPSHDRRVYGCWLVETLNMLPLRALTPGSLQKVF